MKTLTIKDLRQLRRFYGDKMFDFAELYEQFILRAGEPIGDERWISQSGEVRSRTSYFSTLSAAVFVLMPESKLTRTEVTFRPLADEPRKLRVGEYWMSRIGEWIRQPGDLRYQTEYIPYERIEREYEVEDSKC